MEIDAPYLQAIQAIAGKTPGEKLKTINSIARRIAVEAESFGHSVDSETQIPDFPELLKPVVRVEVAKILRQYDVIIEALKSEDMNVVHRALHAKWFFDGSDTSLVNAQYVIGNVFPEISLYTRLRMVKNFGTYLKNTALAADLFLTLSEQYGVSQAIPLLVACSEDFAFKMIIEKKIVLPSKTVESLYRKYPNLVIKYLRLSKPVDNNARNINQINIRDYESFLSEVAHDRFEDFMDICDMHDGLDVKLGKRATNTFFKTRLDLLVERPAQYIKLVCLKKVTQKLCVSDFKKMIKNLFPPERDDFCYTTLNSYLKYYEPEDERLPLILNTFREVYSKDLLSCKSFIDSDLLKVLPVDDRVKEVRLKLENDKDWHMWEIERSWRCYLPTRKSIPIITKQIAESSDAGARGNLLSQLVYTCRVNDDKDAFLRVLNYIYDRHRNEQKYILYGCMRTICDSFELGTLNSAHWEILNKFIKMAEVKGHICDYEDVMSQLIEAAFHYCHLNDLPSDDYMRIFVDMKIQMYHGTWNILTKYPDLEKKFLDSCIEVIPKQYPIDNKIWVDNRGRTILNLASSLWDFNERNKASIGNLKKLSVKDYPWLFEQMKIYIVSETDEYDWSKKNLLSLLREKERNLYYILIQDIEKFWDCESCVISDVLKRQPHRILDNWEKCLKTVGGSVRHERYSSSIITKSRWYQELPIKFFKESLKTHTDPGLCDNSMIILALLADGETYTKIIERFIPSDEKLNVDRPEAKDTYTILLAIATNFRKVNPPVSLDVIASFCVGDYLQMATRSLTSMCHRIPVAKVIPFATMLTNRRVSVMKHGIRIIYLTAPLKEINTHLIDLWNSNGHTSIRLVVFNQIHDLFCKQLDSQSWRLIKTCMDNLNIDDDEKIVKSLTELSTVPNEYLFEYIKSALNAMKAMELKSDDPKLYIDTSCQLIKNIDGSVTQILPEEYCQDLIQKYLFIFDYSPDVFHAGMNLTVHSYLMSPIEYDESRFKFFGDFFRRTVEEYWDKSHPKCSNFYPINFMTSKFFDTVCSITVRHDVRIFEAFLEIFQSVLKPYQDAPSYLDLVYSIAYNKSQTSVDFGTRIVERIPELIEVLSPEYLVLMASKLSSFVSHRSFSETKNSEETLMSIIEVFVDSGAIHCALFAAIMLFRNTSTQLTERYKTVVNALRNFQHPGVLGVLNNRLATFDFCPDNNG